MLEVDRVSLLQHGKILESNKQPDRASLAWNPFNEAFCFERHYHLVHRGRRDSEIIFHIGLRWRTFVDLRIVVDERQVLPLLFRKARFHRGTGAIYSLPSKTTTPRVDFKLRPLRHRAPR